jgi:hypothetical protein
LQIGKNKTLRCGLDGHHRTLSMLATPAGVVRESQNDFVCQQIDDLCKQGVVPVFIRWYDSTPCRVAFGALQQEVYPFARYPHLDGDIWRVLSYNDYRAANPRARLFRRGVMDLLAQGAVCRYLKPDSGELCGFRRFCSPVFLEKNNASCLISALDSEAPEFSLDGLRAIATCVPLGVLVQNQMRARQIVG